jgi:MoaA/NifB/PqqE/SkfB family radical SAM enzyme
MENAPKAIEINIGLTCNNACIFCPNGTVPKEGRAFVSRGKVLEEVRRAYDGGYRALGFLGGEVLVYPHAVEVVRAARDMGFTRISLCTNGRKLARPGALREVIDAGVTRVALSIHSHVAEIEDRLNARKGAYAQKLAAIDALVASAARGELPHGFSLNSCIHGLNCRRLREMAAFFHARGVRDIRFNFLRPQFQAVGNRELAPRFSDCIPEALALVLQNERQLRMTVTFGDIPLCLWPETFLSNRRLAGAYIGELRDLLTDVTFFNDQDAAMEADRFTWKKRRADSCKRYADDCARCVLKEHCEGVWNEYADMYGLGEVHPIARL